MQSLFPKWRSLLSYGAISCAITLFLRILTGVALAADAEGDVPTWLASLGAFNLFVYGSMIGLTIATLAIVGVWLKEVAQKTVW